MGSVSVCWNVDVPVSLQAIGPTLSNKQFVPVSSKPLFLTAYHPLKIGPTSFCIKASRESHSVVPHDEYSQNAPLEDTNNDGFMCYGFHLAR